MSHAVCVSVSQVQHLLRLLFKPYTDTHFPPPTAMITNVCVYVQRVQSVRVSVTSFTYITYTVRFIDSSFFVRRQRQRERVKIEKKLHFRD